MWLRTQRSDSPKVMHFQRIRNHYLENKAFTHICPMLLPKYTFSYMPTVGCKWRECIQSFYVWNPSPAPLKACLSVAPGLRELFGGMCPQKTKLRVAVTPCLWWPWANRTGLSGKCGSSQQRNQPGCACCWLNMPDVTVVGPAPPQGSEQLTLILSLIKSVALNELKRPNLIRGVYFACVDEKQSSRHY